MPPLFFHLLLHATYSLPDESPDPRSKALVLVKVWCLMILFTVTLLAGVSPYLMKWNEGFILLGTQFAGGVFLGTALMQFLSDSDEVFERLTNRDYPFAFMLAGVGFSLTMMVDGIILHVCRKNCNSSADGSLQRRKSIASSSTGTSQTQVDHSTDQVLDVLFLNAISFGDSVLLITGLCLHSVFEGIAIGVVDTQVRAWRALWTVGLHRVFAAIAMGIGLLRTIPDRPLLSCAAYALSFAISSPIGVAIGIVIDATAQGTVGDWIYAMSMGLACGIFIWVSVSHLLFKGYLPRRRISVDTPHHKFLAVLLGIGVVSITMVWDHSSRA